MGYAIIKTSTLNAYALNRKILNVIPKDDKYRKLIPSNANFTYGTVSTEGICRLSSVDLKDGTLPYEYKLCSSAGVDLSNQQSRAGVRIDPISGVIVLSDDYDGQDVWVRLAPKTVTGYYDTSVLTLYKKVISAGSWTPVIPDTHTAALDSVVYSFGDNYNWNSNSLTAAETLLNLTSVTVTYDGQLSTFSGSDLTTFINDVTNPLILGLVSGTSIVNLTSTIRQFTVPANSNSNQRTINFTVSLKYKGISVSYTLTNGLMQEANTLVSIDTNSIRYLNLASPITLDTGTTLSASDFTATGTFSNGTTNTISATGITLNGTSVNSVVQDLNTYTLTFASSITGTYTITGLASTADKAYIFNIGNLSGNVYPTKEEDSYTWPLYVTVRKNGTEDRVMTFLDYIEMLEAKETYSSPVVTFSTNLNYVNMPSVSNGQLIYDFTAPNYIYDRTKIASISIACTSGGSDVTPISNYSTIRKHHEDTSYFDENFEVPELLTTENYLIEVTDRAGHVSNDSDTTNGHIDLPTNNSGTIYKIDLAKLQAANIAIDNFYLYITGSETDGAIISSSNTLTATTYDINYTGDVKYIFADSNTNGIFVHHTPTSGLDTYLIQGSAYNTPNLALKWYILIPKVNNYGQIVIDSDVTVTPNSLTLAGGQITITPPTYHQSYQGSNVNNDGTISYYLSINDGPFTSITLEANNTYNIPTNSTSIAKSYKIKAEISAHNRTKSSYSDSVLQEANSSATIPVITSIVSNADSSNHLYPYGNDTATGNLVTSNNNNQIEFPLMVNVLGSDTPMSYAAYKKAYPNSTYSTVTASYANPNALASYTIYVNLNFVNAQTGALTFDFNADKYIINRSAINRITINNTNGSDVVLSGDIITLHKHKSPTIKEYFEDNFTWSSSGVSNSYNYKLKSPHYNDGSNYTEDQFKLESSSSQKRLMLLTLKDVYYIRLKVTSTYPNFAVIEAPNADELTMSTSTTYTNANCNFMLGGAGGTADEWMYIKYTPSSPNNKVYYVDTVGSSDVVIEFGTPN